LNKTLSGKPGAVQGEFGMALEGHRSCESGAAPGAGSIRSRNRVPNGRAGFLPVASGGTRAFMRAPVAARCDNGALDGPAPCPRGMERSAAWLSGYVEVRMHALFDLLSHYLPDMRRNLLPVGKKSEAFIELFSGMIRWESSKRPSHRLPPSSTTSILKPDARGVHRS
jgi:hypothetical protein